MPALPLHEAGKYVAAAYVVLFALVLIYVAIMAVRLSRMERDLGELLGHAREGEPPRGPHAGEGESPRAPQSGLARDGRAGDPDPLDPNPRDVGRPESTPV